jgi:hypothetical protein
VRKEKSDFGLFMCREVDWSLLTYSQNCDVAVSGEGVVVGVHEDPRDISGDATTGGWREENVAGNDAPVDRIDDFEARVEHAAG